MCVTLNPSGDYNRKVKQLKEVPKPTGINQMKFFSFFSINIAFTFILLYGCVGGYVSVHATVQVWRSEDRDLLLFSIICVLWAKLLASGLVASISTNGAMPPAHDGFLL